MILFLVRREKGNLDDVDGKDERENLVPRFLPEIYFVCIDI